MTHALRTSLLTLIISTLFVGSLTAQQPQSIGRGVVAGTGVVKIERPPAVVIMTIQLMGKGENVKEAIDKLKERREDSLLLLDALGADKDSIEFGEPTTSNVMSQRRQQFQKMVRQRLAATGRSVPKGLQLPKSVTVSTSLSARWPLTGQTTEDRLIEVETLVEKIQKADFAAVSGAADLSDEEKELMEEAADMMSSYGEDDGEVAPGTPSFAFAASVSPEERRAAMAEAYQKAKVRAANLAAAAGAELGPLAQLAKSEGADASEMFGGMGYAMQRYWMMQQAQLQSSGVEGESIAPQFGPITFVFSVRANFYIKTEQGR